MIGVLPAKFSLRRWLPGLLLAGWVLPACHDDLLPALSRSAPKIQEGQHIPAKPEVDVVGRLSSAITRDAPAFERLVECDVPEIVFKNEEGTDADRLMTAATRHKLVTLSALVRKRWPDARLRVTEAWDEDGEHGPGSIHYEGRAVDLTTSDRDSGKLAALAELAVRAGFDWVYYESSHIHASTK